MHPAAGGGEAAAEGRRHLHSPSVATLAGLQREVDAGAAGEGQQHLGSVELGGGGEVKGEEEEESGRGGSHAPPRGTAAGGGGKGRWDVSGGAGRPGGRRGEGTGRARPLSSPLRRP